MEKTRARLTNLTVLLVLLGILATTGVIVTQLPFNTASAAPVLYNEDAVVALYERANPAVVEVNVSQSTSSRYGFMVPQSGQGSGFLVDTDGHILTNYHVVQGAARVSVTLSDGRTLDARVVGTSPADDLALLKVDSQAVSGITPLALGDSSAAKPGQMAIALGSPFGLENSITVGVVSGVNRSITSALGRPITGVVQTDAAINHGSSGGPLLNSRGEVIGINTAIEASATGATGIGYALPASTAKDVLSRLLVDTTVKRPWLGIAGMALSPSLAEHLDLSTTRGVYVGTVTPGSPADEAGLVGGGTGTGSTPSAGGDVIIAVDGRNVQSVSDLVSYFNSLRPGNTVELTVVQGGQTLAVSVVLGEWPDA